MKQKTKRLYFINALIVVFTISAVFGLMDGFSLTDTRFLGTGSEKTRKEETQKDCLEAEEAVGVVDAARHDNAFENSESGALPSSKAEPNREEQIPEAETSFDDEVAFVDLDESELEESLSAEILERYGILFKALEEEAELEIGNLVDEAKAEYSATEESQRTLVFKLELMNKYLKLGNALEEAFDQRFYETLDGMEAALQTNDLETEVLKDLEKMYGTQKNERRKALISQALEKL